MKFESIKDLEAFNFQGMVANYYPEELTAIVFTEYAYEQLQSYANPEFQRLVSIGKSAIYVTVTKPFIDHSEKHFKRYVESNIVEVDFWFDQQRAWKAGLAIYDKKYDRDNVRNGLSYGSCGLIVAKEIFVEFYMQHRNERFVIDAAVDKQEKTRRRRFNAYSRIIRDFPEFHKVKGKLELRNF